tara:strand:+ start:1793 stop:2227 length:435 start_codon:yes stop_codon:yes gene_type:complete
LGTQAFFYNLQEVADVLKSVCIIINHYYKRGDKIAINVTDDETLDMLDKKLWTFEQISFLPHCTIDEFDETCNIVLFKLEQNDFKKYIDDFNVIVNLTKENCNVEFSDKKFVEIVTSDESQKKISREKFRYYQDKGIKVNYESI